MNNITHKEWEFYLMVQMNAYICNQICQLLFGNMDRFRRENRKFMKTKYIRYNYWLNSH
jgi:hypothetical protein